MTDNRSEWLVDNYAILHEDGIRWVAIDVDSGRLAGLFGTRRQAVAFALGIDE